MVNKISARHILVAKHKLAMMIKEELDGGANFGKLAEKYSTDSSRKRGGNLGSFTRGKMVKEFERAAFNLKVNEISEPIKTQFGYHIIKREK